ncbi:hypothetical protein [Streptomyces sp. IBSBF 2435]|uniref:hypothetical protein n=1 Tax=Streptomyces sp. IBSBF 2435 TaxID=2903531 RepID=UPI002FDBBD22
MRDRSWRLGTSYWYMSIPRASLLWWPLWTVAAGWTLRRPRLPTAYAAVAAPLMTVLTVAFTAGRWAG